MATINGVTFNMQNLRPVAVHRNSVSDQPGSDTNFITDMGYDGLVLRLDGYEETLATYDSVISQFMKSGEQTLVHRTGWQFKVYSAQLTPELIRGFADNYFPYDLILLTSTPYRESTSETSRSKTITTNNQEWSTDNSANDIDTDGSVDAVPDIQVTGGTSSTYNRTSTYDSTNTDAAESSDTTDVWVLTKTYTFTAVSFLAFQLDTVGMDLKSSHGVGYPAYGKVTYTAASLNGGAETDVPGASWSDSTTSYTSYSATDLDIKCAVNENLVVKFYLKSTSGSTAYMVNKDADYTSFRKDACKDAQIYNTADTTVKSNVANEIELDMEFIINVDGTGTIEYADNFTTNKYLDAHWNKSGITYDDPNNELDFGNSEYITYKIDTKHPITGIPTITSIIDIDTGTPTIKISSDDVTYYDIDTAIVDNVSTVYDLDNASNLSLKGLTTFYLKINCDGSSTCSLTTFSLSINIVTIDVEHPIISSDGVSTFRCDQHANSGLNCTIALVYRDRSWPA